MKKPVLTDLEKFITLHIGYQLKSFALSNRANDLGFPGFAHFYQVEAADAFVHTRRMMNYILMSNEQYKTHAPNIDPDQYDSLDIVALMDELVNIKTALLEATNQHIENARVNIDYATVRFYEWYLIDLTEEIDYNRDLRDYMKFDKTQIVTFDRKFDRREEPDVETVQKPFTINEQ